jgi:putative acetyltransferase
MTPAPRYEIRPLAAADDPAVTSIIRTVMPEFGASGPGFAILDPEVDAMHATYTTPRSAYFVVEMDGAVQGGGGVGPLAGATPDICELRKMYFLPSLRGLGAGRALIERCLEAARAMDYRACYLETLTNMGSARALYEKFGFKRLARPLGNTGHFGCNSFYLIEL